MTSVEDLLKKSNDLLANSPSVGKKRKVSRTAQKQSKHGGKPNWHWASYFRQFSNPAVGLVKYARGVRHYMTYYDHYNKFSEVLGQTDLKVLHVYEPTVPHQDGPCTPHTVVYHAHPASSYTCASGCHVKVQGTGSELDPKTKYQFPDIYSYKPGDEPFEVFFKPDADEPPGKWWV